MDKDPSLDPIDVAKLFAGAVLSPKLAAIVGPYSLIILLAMAGAGAALGNRKPTTRGGSFSFFMIMVLISTVLTVPLASAVVKYLDSWEAQWLFLPLAFLLAYIGDRWSRVLSFFAGIARTIILSWASKGKPND